MRSIGNCRRIMHLLILPQCHFSGNFSWVLPSPSFPCAFQDLFLPFPFPPFFVFPFASPEFSGQGAPRPRLPFPLPAPPQPQPSLGTTLQCQLCMLLRVQDHFRPTCGMGKSSKWRAVAHEPSSTDWCRLMNLPARVSPAGLDILLPDRGDLSGDTPWPGQGRCSSGAVSPRWQSNC